MTFQEYFHFKSASLLAFLFISLGSSQPVREIGRVVVDGVEKPVFYEDKGGVPQKYFLGESGNRVDLAGHQRRKAQEKRDKFGVFGKKLYDTLSTMKAEEEVDVHITFALRALPGQLRNKKLSKEDADAQLQASFLDGIETLGRRFGRLPSEIVDFKGKNSLRLRLRKSELLEFKTNSRIRSIELPVNPSQEKVLRQAPLEESFMGSGWSSGGLHFSGDCGGGNGCGSGTYVGVLEKNPIWNSDSADHLSGSWFEKRPGTPIAPRHPHGLWTSSIIRNSGPGLGGSAFNGGGAYNANLSLSYPVAPESTMQDAYDWLLSRYNKIISHSWRFPRYLGGAHEAEANEFERQMDMATAGYPYVLNVLAAGNSGDTADGGENDDCVDSSAVYNAPGWTAEQCQTVAWWNHNGLIVGAVDNDSTRSSFSAFRNGPEDNESPHVMVRGSGIQLPWMAPMDSSTTCPTDTAVANASGPLCGTSMAAPTVAALGAHIAGIGALSSYPEVVKGIIIASATSRPIRRSAWKRYAFDFYPFLDREIGAGIPHQPTADSIVKNEKYVSNFSSGAYGFKKFFVPSYQTSYEDVDTITITHPHGGRIHFYMTWVGNPSNVTPGTRYAPDDMDLQVETENTWDFYSNSYQNTTEEVIHPILPDSATTFYVKKRLYYRSLDENTPIWGSLVWTYAPPPVVEIHSPLDSSYTNQNEVPVEWSIDGKPDSSGSYSNPLSEGPNLIERCYDGYYFCDVVTVFLDQTPPIVEITSPLTGSTTAEDSILIKWTVDAVPDSLMHALVPGSQIIIISRADLAGNLGADTIEVTSLRFQANISSDSIGFTYQNLLLDGRESTVSPSESVAYRWRQISGESVIILDSTQARTSFLSRSIDTLKFELRVGDQGGLFPTSYDTMTVFIQDPATTFEFMQVLESGKAVQDGKVRISITDPGFEPSYTVFLDTMKLSGTIFSEDTLGSILWSTQYHSGTFSPASHEWSGLAIPLEEGENRLTLLYSMQGEVAVDRILIFSTSDSSISVGAIESRPEVLIADSVAQLKFLCRITGPGISSVQVVRISNGTEAIQGALLDNGIGQDSIANDSVFTGSIALTPSMDTVYRYRAKITRGTDVVYSPFLTIYPQEKMTDSAFSIMEAIIGFADSVYSDRLLTMDTLAAMKSVVDWLVTQPDVAVAGISPGDKAICWQFNNGIHALISLAPEGSMGANSPVTVNGLSPFKQNFSHRTIGKPWGDTLAALYGSGGAIDGDAFDHLYIRLKADSLLNLYWPDPNLEAQSLEMWKNIGAAKLVNISTHGNSFGYYPYRRNAALPNFDKMVRGQTDFSKGAFLTLNSGIQVFKEGPADNRQYVQGLIDAGEFRVLTTDGFPKMVFYITHAEETELPRIYLGITPNFFKKYAPKMPKSLVFLNACRSLYPKAIGPTFWDVFKSKGSLAMVGYDDYVQSTFAGISTRIIQGSLLRGESLKTGINNSTQKWDLLTEGDAGRCDWGSPQSCLVVRGDSNMFLAAGVGYGAGANDDGQLGIGSQGNGSSTFIQLSGTKPDWVSLHPAMGNGNSVGLDAGKRVWTWGLNNGGQLGTGSTSPENRDEPGLVPSISGVTGVSMGAFHVLAVKENGSAWGWGNNLMGQLGLGSTAQSNSAVQLPGVSGVISVKAGTSHSLILLSTGTVLATGSNFSGKLGVACSPTCSQIDVMSQVTGLSNIVAIGAGQHHSMALKADGTVWTWGGNGQGALGLGSTYGNTTTPTQVPGLSNIVAIEAAHSGGIALREDGVVYRWGATTNVSYFFTPQVVSSLGTAVSIGGSDGGGFAIMNTRKLMVWGFGNYGQFGTGGVTSHPSPSEVPGMSNVFSIKSMSQSFGILIPSP